LDENVQSSEPRSAPGGEAPPPIATLTRRMAEGDEMAWRTFYNAYFDRLWRYLLVVASGNEDTAREAMQGALIRVARHVKVFHDETTFWSWLTVVARTAFADETKKRRRYFSFLDRFTSQTKIEFNGISGAQTDERLRTLLERHVKSLPPDEQKLVEQKYFEHRSVREIAVELQTTEKAVESKLSRIRGKLKDAVLAELNEQKD